MTAVVVMLRNPFCPERGREVLPVAAGTTIRAWLDAHGITEFERPTICLRNGEPVLRADWPVLQICASDVVIFVSLPQGGGGGGGGGKNPLRTVLMIAVMVAAPAIGGAIAGAIGITSTIGTSLITAAVGLAGATLVNVLVPLPKPPAPSFGGSFGSTPAPSPTYALQSQGNQARLGQPIPVIYGRHLVYPDLAATPWTEYAGNEQYLHQLHCIGQGEYDLEQVRIEDTPISSFEEVTYEIVVPGAPVTLFEADVTTAAEVAGQELKGTNELEAGDDGWIGPFAANPAATAEEIGIDLVMPRGLYANTSVVSIRAPSPGRWRRARSTTTAAPSGAGCSWGRRASPPPPTPPSGAPIAIRSQAGATRFVSGGPTRRIPTPARGTRSAGRD